MSLDVSLQVLKQSSSGFVFTSNAERENGRWFGFLWFFFNLCCELLCCSLCFFTSVLRRTITLLTQLAKGMASHAALETQVNDATEAAKKYMAENERLQEVSLNFFCFFLIQQVVSTKYSGDGLLLNDVCSYFLFW